LSMSSSIEVGESEVTKQSEQKQVYGTSRSGTCGSDAAQAGWFLLATRSAMMDGRVSRQRREGDGGALAGGDAKVKERWQAATRR
jgi:hypothetical protein